MGEKIRRLDRLFEDGRGKRVVFLSHCILNENMRHPGGACGSCVRGIVEQCLDADVGTVQMPCPEQRAWGGVAKRFLLAAYGTRGTLPYRLRRVLLPLAVAYTRFVYRRLARRTADEIQDYLDSGFSVAGVVGVDGSPSCGVARTLDLERSFDSVMEMDVSRITAALKEELRKRQIDVPLLAHDLIGELDGRRSGVDISSVTSREDAAPLQRADGP